MLLDKVRVVDLSRVLAGPIATMVLGDLGADIIKIEPPQGDETRTWTPMVDGESAYYLSANRNKRSIVIDLKREEGREIIYKLVKTSDVVIENFRPGVPESLKIDYNSLKNIKPDIIYCSIKGFGSKSSYATRPAYDLLLQAMSGLMASTGEEGRPPVRVAFALYDIIAGLIASVSIVAALYDRTLSGKGRYIEVSLYDSSIFAMSYIAMIYLMTGKMPKKMGSAHPSIVPYQTFECGDGKHLAVAVTNERFWENFCKALRLEELIADPRFKSNPDRVKNRQELIEMLSKKFKEKSRSEWIKLFEEYGVPYGPVYTLDEVFNDPHVVASGIVGEVKHPTLGMIKQLLYPALIDNVRPKPRKAPPRMGEDAISILKELGYSDADIEKLISTRVVCCKLS